ncbi:MarR family winged helix-turn-helix transcriptional regulator [Sphingobium estronivorans]|uniref:MarR family winged helix-turn-helix transcriptional regulator n=1 Tax=Sphingobium estronivorans TaxID=1577690 RepID=UPI00123B5582|nr:MarR family winged helix-turn-helix transcriptional regulator [Sphingobium estronivorans]
MNSSRLKQMPGHLIRRANQISSAIFSEEMVEYELTAVQLIALATIIDRPGMDATRLAEYIDFDKATIGGVIERLERKRLVERRVSQADKRIKELVATPAGRALVSVSMPHIERVQERILQPLSSGEQAQLMSLLKRIVAGFANSPSDAK